MSDNEGLDEYDEALLEEDIHRKTKRFWKEVDDDSDDEQNEALATLHKKKKPDKTVSYMKKSDIEGQEETIIEEEDGIKIEPFNMNEEFQEGQFDEAGFYTRKEDADASHDAWLDNITAEDIRKAKEAQEAKMRRIGDGSEEAGEQKREELSQGKALTQLIDLLQPEETPTSALRRLRPPPKKFQRVKNFGKEATTEESKRIAAEIGKITECCDQLFGTGLHDVYSTPREDLITQLENMPTTSSLMNNNPDVVMWKYKWNENSEVFGPFDSKQMLQWQEQNFFPSGILVSKLENGTESEYYSSKRVDFSLYTDDD